MIEAKCEFCGYTEEVEFVEDCDYFECVPCEASKNEALEENHGDFMNDR